MTKLFVTRKFIRSSPTVQGVMDRRQVHFHFRPVRPADIAVSLDPVSGEVNLAAGTYGVAAWNPLTIGIHIHKSSYDSQRNVSAAPLGTELVIALPGRDIVRETWFTSMPIPRGINEGELGRLTLMPSRLVKPPSIAECPVNLETVIERIDLYGIHHIVLCRVLGATIGQEFIGMDRLSTLRRYPTHECDDVDNAWRGAVERLSLVGELLPCPTFPCGPRRGLNGSFDEWLAELGAAGCLTPANAARLQTWAADWWQIAAQPDASERAGLRARLSRAVELAAWEEFDVLNAFLESEGEEVPA
jgi:flavin reductase (DIM6/NTAB) family NADH-FMN oxidoreductase RutF